MNENKVKGFGRDSHFEINLLQHCLNLLNETELTPNVRYQTSLILASLQNEEITSFLIEFLTKISLEEFMRLHFMATTDFEKTEEFLKSNIKTDGINDLFRDFLVPKNNEVFLLYGYLVSNGYSVHSNVPNKNRKST